MKRTYNFIARTPPKLKMRRNDSAMDTNELSREQGDQDLRASTDSLDVYALGMHCGNALNKLGFALVRYRQRPKGPLCAELLKVRLRVFRKPHVLTLLISLVRSRSHTRSRILSSLRYVSLRTDLP